MSLLACLLVPAALAAPAVTLDPPSVVQGSWAVLRVAAGPGARGDAVALGRALPLFAAEGGLRALVPVPLTTAPGRRTVTVRVAGREFRAGVTVKRRSAPAPQVLASLNVDGARAGSLRASKERLGPALRRVTPAALWSGPFRRPAPGPLSAAFAAPRSYGGGAGWPHRGLDFAAQRGWPVAAAAPGVVTLARRLAQYGNAVVLDHGQTVATAYFHMTALAVRDGDRVAQGQVLGTVGATGMATGPHLHFGAYIAGVAVDPAELLERGLP